MMAWLIGVPVRWIHAAHPAPRVNPTIAPKKKSAFVPELSESTKAAMRVSGTARSRETPAPASSAAQSQRPVTGPD
jgi:hypothetical protein